MLRTVIKRNGEKVPFDSKKISSAICKAMKEDADDKNAEIESRILAGLVAQTFDDEDTISVEEIQDEVEMTLMDQGYYEVAQRYIRYRYKRELVREPDSRLMTEIAEKVMATNVENQNANLDEYSAGGRTGAVSSHVLKQFALDHCMSEKSKLNHLNNEIYVHDLDAYAIGISNCLSLPFDDLLANGFTTRQVDIRPANSINTAMQLVAVIFQIQSLQQFGKNTLPN